jgi:hypothetical protein
MERWLIVLSGTKKGSVTFLNLKNPAPKQEREFEIGRILHLKSEITNF